MRSTPLDILLNDDAIVAVSKPAGLAAIAGRGEDRNLLQTLAEQLGLPFTGSTDPRLRVVHRLDKDTTGVMLFAKTVEAQRHLSHQFQNNTIQKEYLAIVAGSPMADSGTIDAPLAPHPNDKLRMAVDPKKRLGGRPAVTDWRVEARARAFALFRAFPKTGKTHQIRVHLAHLGHPLAIDPLYGSADPIFLSQYKRNYRPTRGEEERPLIARLTLHAHRLTFVHPDGQPRTVVAPLPKDLRAAVRQIFGVTLS